MCGKLTVNMPVFIAATVTVAFSVDMRKTVRTLDMPLPDGCSAGGSCSHTVVVFKRFVLESIVLVVQPTLPRGERKLKMSGQGCTRREDWAVIIRMQGVARQTQTSDIMITLEAHGAWRDGLRFGNTCLETKKEILKGVERLEILESVPQTVLSKCYAESMAELTRSFASRYFTQSPKVFGPASLTVTTRWWRRDSVTDAETEASSGDDTGLPSHFGTLLCSRNHYCFWSIATKPIIYGNGLFRFRRPTHPHK